MHTCIHTQLLLIKSVLDKYRIFQLLSGGVSNRASTQPATSLQSPSHPHEASPLFGGGSHHHPLQRYHATTPVVGALGEEDSAAADGPTGGRPVVAAATVAAANANSAGGVVGWEALTWWDQIEILNVWTLVAMAGCVCVLLFAGLAVRARDDLMVDGALRVLVGLSSLLLWLALIQYLEYDPRYYTLVLTIRRAVPRIVQFVGGIVPMFIGYCLLGTILFGDRTEYFGSLSKTAATLFCVVVSELFACMDTDRHAQCVRLLRPPSISFLQTFPPQISRATEWRLHQVGARLHQLRARGGRAVHRGLPLPLRLRVSKEGFRFDQTPGPNASDYDMMILNKHPNTPTPTTQVPYDHDRHH